MFLREALRIESRKSISRKQTKNIIQPGVAQLVARVVWERRLTHLRPFPQILNKALHTAVSALYFSAEMCYNRATTT